MKKQKIILALFVLCMTPLALAVAPVVDYSTDATDSASAANVSSDSGGASVMSVTPTQPRASYNQIPSEQIVEGTPNVRPVRDANVYPMQDTSNMSTAQRINRLEQQVNYLNNLNANLDDLRQKLQKTQGDLEIQQHKTEQLEKQLNDFYADLDQRISKTKGVSSSKVAVGNANFGGNDGSASVVASTKPVAKKKDNLTSSVKKTTKTTSVVVADSTSVSGSDVVATASSTSAAVPAKTAVTKESTVQEQQSYQSAFDSLQNKQYDVAVKKLRAYLSSYPDGIYAGNAHYWLGELYFQGNSYAKASTEFDHVVSKYLGSSKVPDAMFKLAYIHDKEGKREQAQNEYKELKKRFPKSGAAKLADEQLSIKN